MMREPLMLSDTAMVLLRRYIEVSEYKEAFIEAYGARAKEWDLTGLQQHFESVDVVLDDLRRELAIEVWILWENPTVALQRSLAGHLILYGEVIRKVELLFDSPPHSLLSDGRMNAHRLWREALVARLVKNYQKY